MMTLFGLFGRASAKLIATFVMVIILILLGFAFFPSALNALNDFANTLEGMLRNPPLNEQATVLYRTLVNENTIFGIVMTMIARSVVELFALLFGRGRKMVFGG